MSSLVRASDRSFLVVFGEGITDRATDGVRRLHAWLCDEPIRGVVDVHPAFATVLVRFDPDGHEPREIEGALAARLASLRDHPVPEPRSFDVAVRYGGADGPDLAEVASATGLGEGEVVAAHAAAVYRVAFLGFSPGFPYLIGLPAVLTTARRSAPRRRVPAGSVAIAGAQAGIYPLASPGGWNIIGRTDLALFDAERNPPALLAHGDLVRFVAVDAP